MGELHELTGTMCALKNVEEVELVGMPKLKRCTLMGAFKSVKSVKMENAGKFESLKVLTEAMEKEKRRQEEKEREKKDEEERKQREEQERNREREQMKSEIEAWKRGEEEKRKKEIDDLKRTIEEQKKNEVETWKRIFEMQKKKEIDELKKQIDDHRNPPTPSIDDRVVLERRTVTIKSGNSLDNANCYIGIIVIASKCCNDTEMKMLNLKRFVSLRSFEVGDECFKNVEAVYAVNMKRMERLVIGKKCFSGDNGYNEKSKGELYVDGCEKLEELKIGNKSFMNYTVCEIANVENMQLIEMGDECFENAKKMKLIGLKRLVRLEMGESCFKNDDDRWRSGVFNLKDCEEMRVLRLGSDSFKGYSVCKIEGVNSLEVIEMKGSNFLTGALELKSDSQRMK